MVIAGQLDLYWDAGMWPWDVCVSFEAKNCLLIMQAGMCILRETGGYCSGGADAFARRAEDAEILMSRRIVAIRAVAPEEVRSGAFSS
jgi:myo-inositol-1(or 4)-monophosphatase